MESIYETSVVAYRQSVNTPIFLFVFDGQGRYSTRYLFICEIFDIYQFFMRVQNFYQLFLNALFLLSVYSL